MSVAFRIRAWPRAAATGAAVAIFLAGGNNGAPHHDGVNHYQAGLVADPRFEAMVSFTDEGWGAKAVPLASAIGWAPSDPTKLDPMAALYWKDAAIEIDRIKNGVTTRRLTGTVAEATVADGKLIITCADLSQKLDKPFTTATFAGTGGIEGGDVATGRAKRRSFGLVWNVEGRLLDKVNNIYEFGDPAFALQGCTALRDMGRAGPLGIIAWQGSIDATLNALKAATPQRGGGLFAPSIACAKWWTQPAGPLTADLQGEASGYSQTPAGVAAQLLAAVGGPAISDTGSARATPVGLHIGDNSETTSGALDRLLQRIAMGWRLSSVGTVELWDYRFTAPVETLRAIFISRDSTVQPVKSRTVGYKKNERVHGEGEISAAVQASDVVYEDGTTGEEMKPAEPDATNGATIGDNFYDFDGNLVDRDEFFNDALTLKSDGELVRRLGEQIIPLGRLDIVEAGGATAAALTAAHEANAQALADAEQAAAEADAILSAGAARLAASGEQTIRQMIRAQASVDDALHLITIEAQRTRDVFRDAGIVIDPATGTARIYAIEQQADALSQVSIELAAQQAKITLSATRTFVREQILLAQIDPSQVADLEPLIARITSTEITIDGLLAQVASKASAVTLTALQQTVTNVSQTLDALAGTVTTKVDQTVFDALGASVGSIEQTLSALGDTSSIVTSLSQARSSIRAAAENAYASLGAVLSGDVADRYVLDAIATARQELYTKTVDGLAAESGARLQLAAQFTAANVNQLALYDLAQTARAAGDAANAQVIEQLAARVTTENAAMAAQVQADREASVTRDGANAAATTLLSARSTRADADGAYAALDATLAGTENQQRVIDLLATVRHELYTRTVDGLSAEAGSRLELAARLTGFNQALTALIVAERFARVDGQTAIASELEALTAQLASEVSTILAQIGTDREASVTRDNAQVQSTTALAAELRGADDTTTARVADNDSASVTRDAAIADRTEQVLAALQSVDYALSADIVEKDQASITRDQANASSIAQVSARLNGAGGGNVTVEQALLAAADAINGIRAEYSVKLQGQTANGIPIIGGFGLLLDDGSIRAAFAVDEFVIGSTGANGLVVFEVVDGVVRMREAAIGDLTVGTLKLKNGSVTQRAAVTSAQDYAGQGATLITVASYSLVIAYPAEVIISMTGRQNYVGSIPDFGAQLLVNGVAYEGPSGGATFGQASFADTFKVSLDAGTHSLAMQWRGGSSAITLRKGSLIIDATFK